MAIQALSGDQWFENLSGGKWPDTPDKIYPFPVHVALPKWRPSRHEYWEFMLEMGRGEVLAALAGKPVQPKLLVVFPERYISIQEQYIFMSAIARNQTKIRLFEMVTQSPIIIGNFLRTQLRIVTWPEDEGVYDESMFDRFKG